MKSVKVGTCVRGGGGWGSPKYLGRVTLVRNGTAEIMSAGGKQHTSSVTSLRASKACPRRATAHKSYQAVLATTVKTPKPLVRKHHRAASVSSKAPKHTRHHAARAGVKAVTVKGKAAPVIVPAAVLKAERLDPSNSGNAGAGSGHHAGAGGGRHGGNVAPSEDQSGASSTSTRTKASTTGNKTSTYTSTSTVTNSPMPTALVLGLAALVIAPLIASAASAPAAHPPAAV